MRSSRGSALSRMGSAPRSVSSAGPPSPEGLRAVTCWLWRVTSWVSSRWLGSSETGSRLSKWIAKARSSAGLITPYAIST